jgi:3-isopropylmalate/(R)-2-methylmalate dehydratase small subunit
MTNIDFSALKGRAWQFGDNVPTDQIVATNVVFSPIEVVLKHVLEELKPQFPAQVKPGDIIVAGHHFGQSSGRAIAPKAIQAAGVACIVAESFARTFLRNCFEIGMPIIECPGAGTLAKDGDIVSVDLVGGRVTNETTGVTRHGRPIDPFLLNMLKAGGIIPMVKQSGADLGASGRKRAGS